MTEAGRPTEIGRYQVVDVLGSGAMGIVYKAHDPAIGRDVAIKVVRIDADGAEARAAAVNRFRQEVQAAGRCSHASIVGVFDFLDQGGDPAIVMELVEGNSLLFHLRAPERRAALVIPSIILQVLDALGYAHGQGIIHRDIKPANILLTSSRQVKIADFGIARVAGSSTTLSGAVVGTPSYMAPEQLAGDTVDRRTDLFAVGAILHEMLSGRPPFAGRTVAETLMRVSGPDAADLGPVMAAGGQAYLEVLRRALAKDRAHRFQFADEFAAALQAASSHHAAVDAPATVVMPSRAPASALPSRAWDPSLLQRVEQQLAKFVGPMARLMVMRTAQETTSAEELYATLARGLPSAADRSLFLHAVGGGRVEPTLGGRNAARTMGSGTMAPKGPGTMAPPSVSPPAMTLSGTVQISAEAAAAARAALVWSVGPIAGVLVRDAAAKATSGRDFIDRLCAHVTKPDELAALRRRLRAEVEPKLA